MNPELVSNHLVGNGLDIAELLSDSANSSTQRE
jgi:hypothetical protein